MKQFTALILLVLVGLVDVYAHDSNEKSLAEVNRKRLLLNLLHALRTLRDHKKVTSTRIEFPKFVHSDNEHHIRTASNPISPFTKTIDDVQSTSPTNQISKRSKGIHKESTVKGNHDGRPKNGKELFLQLLETLKRIKKRKNKKRGQTSYLSRNHEKHGTMEKQMIKENFPRPLAQPHTRKTIQEFDQRSSVLKPVKINAKIGTSQTNKARYSFAQARLSFLQSLDTAQDEKLTKLGNLEKKFSDILPKSEKRNRQNVGKEVKYTLQDFTKDESATALSHIHQSYKKLLYKPLQNVIPIKHSLLGEPLKKKLNLSNHILNKQKNVASLSIPVAPQNGIEKLIKTIPTPNVDLKSTYENKKKPNGTLPSIVDELLGISNARNKLEKLKRLRKLQAKLLNNIPENETKKQKYENSLHNNDGKSTSPWRIRNEQKRPTNFNNVAHQKSTNVNKTSQKVVYGKPYKRYNQHNSVQMDSNNTFSFPGNGSSDKISHTNEQHARKTVEYTNTFDDFDDATQDKKEPIHSIIDHPTHSGLSKQPRLDESPVSYSKHSNDTAQEAQYKMANIHLVGKLPTINKNQSRYQYPRGSGNKPITSSNGITGNSGLNQSTIEDKFNDTHNNTGHVALLQKHYTKHLADSGQQAGKQISKSHDINIIGTTSSKNLTNDQSYLPLDSSATPLQTKSEDSKTPLSSVISEHNKIISELVSSTSLAKHLLKDKSESSHKTLSNVLQKAQNMFLKKVKEILSGNKTNRKDKTDDTNIVDNKSRDNSSKKPEGGVINTSAYVMDESPSNAKAATNVGQDASGIVPKTPTNDDLASSLNRNMAEPASPIQNAGINSPMHLLQTPTDPNPPLIAQSVAQTGQGNPVSGRPLTYTQLQDAHEEERVALQQENTFRSMQNPGNSPLSNDANAPSNSATTAYQSYIESNQVPQANRYPIHNPGFPAPNVDDLSEYRGGMERYQLSHHIGYNRGEEVEDDYPPRRHHFPLYGHRIADEDGEGDEDDDDFNDDDEDDDFDENGEKKSNIGKPHHSRKHKHLKYHFKNGFNSTKIDHAKHKKLQVKSKVYATNNTRRKDR